MRLIFMGTPHFAVPSLEKLLDSAHQVVAVFTQPDRPAGRGEKVAVPPIKGLALRQGIPVYQPENLKEAEWGRTFLEIRADALVVVAYGMILPRWLLQISTYGAYNLHASLLPKYRGAAPIQWAIANGEPETGVTTMKLDEGMDTGDILLQKRVPIGPLETTPELQLRLSDIGADLLLHTLQLLESRELRGMPQVSELASYAPCLKKENGCIHWEQWTSHQVFNRIRAFNPWPGTYTHLHTRQLRIWKARPREGTVGSLPPGTLVQETAEDPAVVCAQGLLSLLEVQLENRKRISAKEMLNGLRIPRNQPILLGT
ncbi:MAG: methionyl-tRNA formyltransferase [Terriglobia bacterium]